ncbi:hypothetical protein AYI70_g5108 [Smittium culicis]|uniref:Signal peptidase complex subunit 2 n=1 Tax=Smittium culicis TaxID=133412 RepID=A0A1R1XW17_9FUNG|nr:hypothetical protein AYI70_g5108 [Smittium culicis]
MSNQAKIFADKSNSNELKLACNTEIRKYLNKSGYIESHFHEDLVLAAGYIGAVACLIDFAYSYKFGFNQTIWASYITVPIYAISYLFSLIYNAFVIKKNFYFASNPETNTSISVASSSHKNSDLFEITITLTDSKNISTTTTASHSFGKFFFDDGQLSPTAIHAAVDSLLPSPLKKKE